MEQTEKEYRNVETIIAFLSAYDRKQVRRAVTTWARAYVSQRTKRKRPLWVPLQEGESTNGKEWMEHNGVVYVLNPELKDGHHAKLAQEQMQMKEKMDKYHTTRKEENVARVQEETKQDLSPTVTMIQCPVCGGGIIREPVCRGCTIGKAGFTYRYICQNDTDHIMYSMNKEGLDRELEEEMAKVSQA